MLKHPPLSLTAHHPRLSGTYTYQSPVLSLSPSFARTFSPKSPPKNTKNGLPPALHITRPLALLRPHVPLPPNARPHRRHQPSLRLLPLRLRHALLARSKETRHKPASLLGLAGLVYGGDVYGRVRGWKSRDDGVHLPCGRGRRGVRWNYESKTDWEGFVEAYDVGASGGDDGGWVVGVV
jgi:hypothetical protein